MEIRIPCLLLWCIKRGSCLLRVQGKANTCIHVRCTLLRLASTSTVPQLTRTCHVTAIELADKAASNLLPSPDSYPLAAYLLTLSAKESGLESASTCTSVLVSKRYSQGYYQTNLARHHSWQQRSSPLADGERSSLVALRATSDSKPRARVPASACMRQHNLELVAALQQPSQALKLLPRHRFSAWSSGPLSKREH